MVTRHVQPSFAGGEVSPALAARVDAAAYQTWLKKACNFFVHPQGGASNRPGTAYMAIAKSTGKPCRLIPFVVGEEEAYVLEFGHQYLRVFTSAGQVLGDNNTPYELVTPYLADELPRISFAQYGKQLFLAHPSHPLQVLTCQSAGRFTLTAHAIKYGPFGLSNTQEARQVRIYTTQETMPVEGTAATLSLAPVVDARYFVYGYFRGELFFAADDYGLNIGQLVAAFNTHYGSLGLTATNLGGVIRVTSPQATGGDWNGATLSLTYRDSFAHDPSIVLTEALSGGVNAGGVVPVGDIIYVLQSNFDLFTPADVGGRFSLSHRIESQRKTGAIGYEDVSLTIKSGSDWRLQTSGTWTGTLALEKSEDLGTTWQIVKYFSRTGTQDNIVAFGTLEDTGHLYELRVRACGISGQAGYELSAEAFTQEGIAVITEFLNAREVVISIERAYASDAWTHEWAPGAFSPKNGYPGCVFFYQNRLGLAATQAQPQTLWFSKTGVYDNFGHARGALLDDDAISVNLSGHKLNAIRQVLAAGKLLVFTDASEWTLSSSGALTPYNIVVEQQGERGASYTPALLVGNRALYVQARGSALRDFYYDYSSASYTGEDITLCAKHLFEQKTIADMCRQQEPDNLIWCVLSDGTLAALTYVAEQSVCAWTHHETQGAFRSICTIPNRGYDELWLAVERDGVYHIEKLLPRLASKDPKDQIFLDDSVSKKSDTPFTEISGLTHLEGKTVGILAQGSPLETQTVTNGKITLPRAMTCVHVGLPYQAQLQTLPIGASLASGGLADQKKRVVSVMCQMADSRGGVLALADEQGEEIIQRTTEPYSTPTALKTQSYTLTLPGTHTFGPSLVFTQNDPLPVTLLAVWCKVA